MKPTISLVVYALAAIIFACFIAIAATAYTPLAIIGVATTSVLIAFVALRVLRPLRQLTQAMKTLAAGDAAASIPIFSAAGEIGDMAHALVLLRAVLIEAEHLREAQSLEQRQRADRIAHRHRVTGTFAERVQRLAATFSHSSDAVAQSAQHLSITAEDTAQQAHNVAGAADETAESIQAVAASVEQLSVSIGVINYKVAGSADTAMHASVEAARTDASVKLLVSAAEKIENVVELIKKIAEQTNLLALNATIEAAKAGEAGRSFAIVASEVKQLARQTASATGEISTKVVEIQTAILGTTGSIGKMLATIASIREAAGLIAQSMEEQNSATREIAENTQRVARGTEDVNVNIAGVSEAAKLTQSAARQLTALSSSLSGGATSLQREILQFVEDIQRDDPFRMDFRPAA
ncbi:MAG: HAMP domain-containing methyl-accepting chemotaxis protein [Methylovirgula sp.]|uniref:methyl-accepting chemotaxis protein n=1 Tax=Methylovirgula sp. TaxID=1978224 RepID=UPI0030766F20